MPTELQLKALRALPAVDEVLTMLSRSIPMEAFPHELVVDCIRKEVEAARNLIIEGKTAPSEEGIANGTLRRLQAQAEPSLKRVINATGVIIHTNLGRSALAPQAVTAVENVAKGYSTLEYDLASMQRGSRHSHCEELICTLTGAEAAIAVNNNAAAVMMVLNEFARNRQAIISRGELIEIGGSFRIPDIMDFSNARMVEVGTTNKTHPSDYERAITSETAMLLKVHTSNYRLIGFTESVRAKDLKAIATRENERRNGTGEEELLVYEDLGSGMLLPLRGLEGYGEPTVTEALEGCDLVSFSGDKLLGGPQAGIIVGNKRLIDRLKKNPLARALRLDKMTIAALEATLRLYLDPEKAYESIPTLHMLTAPIETVGAKAEALRQAICASVPKDSCKISVVESVARAGGGSLPMYDIPSYAVEIERAGWNAQECAAYLVQNHQIPVIARISREKLLFDARTIMDDEEIKEIAAALASFFARSH